MKNSVVLAIALMSIGICVACPADAAIVSLAPIQDVEITGDSPFGEFNQWANTDPVSGSYLLHVERSVGQTVVRDALMRFDLSSIADGATLNSAQLRFKLDSISDPQGVYVIVRTVTDAGALALSTTYFQPGHINPNGDNSPSNPLRTSGLQFVDVSGLLQPFIASNADFVVLQFSAVSGQSFDIRSGRPPFDPSTDQPQITVEYSTPDVSSVPEPGTLAIWGLGALGMAVAAGRRRRRSA